MITVPCSNGSFDRIEEIRRVVARAKATGALRTAGTPKRIEKNGQPVASEGGLRSQWMDVTPAMARQWLVNNFLNRPLKSDVIQAYAREMLNGTWVATHQGVAFNNRDELIDGQHRLHAIVRSGVTARMMVTFGLPSEITGREMTAMDAVDRGIRRSVADQLKIQHGFPNAGITAAVCRTIAALCSEERTRRLGVGQTLEIFRAFEETIGFVIKQRAKEHGLRQAGLLAGFAFAIAADPAIRPLYTILLAGDGPAAKRGSPLGLLRTFLLSEEAKLLSRRTDRGISELVLQAIYLECLGRQITKFELAPDGADHYREAQRDRVAKIAALFALPESAK